MRFEVSYSTGSTHEVTLAGSVAVLGRDPGCDIVLNDSKCSRRHAVVEDTPEGLVIRDSGSANGVYVNERRVDRSFLQPGDTIRLGDARLRLLAEIGETVIVALDDVPLPPAPAHESLTQPPFPAPQAAPAGTGAVSVPAASPPPEPSRAAQAPPLPRSTARRPPTVRVLAALWAAFGPAASAAIALTAARLDAGAIEWAAAALLGLLLVSAGLAMAFGLRALAPWARHLQIASSYLGLLVCPFTPVAATSLLYMSRAEVRRVFEQRRANGASGSAETTFALSIVFMTLVGVVLTAIMAFLIWPLR